MLTTPSYLPTVDFNSQFAMRKRSKGRTGANCILGAKGRSVWWTVGVVVSCACNALYVVGWTRGRGVCLPGRDTFESCRAVRWDL